MDMFMYQMEYDLARFDRLTADEKDKVMSRFSLVNNYVVNAVVRSKSRDLHERVIILLENYYKKTREGYINYNVIKSGLLESISDGKPRIETCMRISNNRYSFDYFEYYGYDARETEKLFERPQDKTLMRSIAIQMVRKYASVEAVDIFLTKTKEVLPKTEYTTIIEIMLDRSFSDSTLHIYEHLIKHPDLDLDQYRERYLIRGEPIQTSLRLPRNIRILEARKIYRLAGKVFGLPYSQRNNVVTDSDYFDTDHTKKELQELYDDLTSDERQDMITIIKATYIYDFSLIEFVVENKLPMPTINWLTLKYAIEKNDTGLVKYLIGFPPAELGFTREQLVFIAERVVMALNIEPYQLMKTVEPYKTVVAECLRGMLDSSTNDLLICNPGVFEDYLNSYSVYGSLVGSKPTISLVTRLKTLKYVNMANQRYIRIQIGLTCVHTISPFLYVYIRWILRTRNIERHRMKWRRVMSRLTYAPARFRLADSSCDSSCDVNDCWFPGGIKFQEAQDRFDATLARMTA